MEKIILIDVDGTLLDYENKLPESAKMAIRQARQNGHKVYICTGRSKAEVYDYIWDIGLDGMIGGNGSYVEDNGEVIMHQLITAEQCKHVVDWLHDRHLEFYLESNSGLYASENFEVVADPVIKVDCQRKGKENTDQLAVRDVFPEMIYGGEHYRDDVNKISFILSSYQDHLDSKVEFPHLIANTWGGKGEVALFGDLGPTGITKRHAIEVLLDYLGADPKDTISFGDAKIDLSMFECCAYNVAMGNGGPEIKAAADYITTDVNDDGLYNAFKYLKLID